MVGQLKYFATDPNHKRRGDGFYWHRGNGIYSKFTGDVDASVKAHRTHIDDPMKRLEAELKRPHMADYHTNKRKEFRTPRTSFEGHPVPKGKKGYF